MSKSTKSFQEVTAACCELLNACPLFPRRPAAYSNGGISMEIEQGRASVSIHIDPYFQDHKLCWKVRVSSNANGLSPVQSGQFAKLYTDVSALAFTAQAYLNSVEVDMSTLA